MKKQIKMVKINHILFYFPFIILCLIHNSCNQTSKQVENNTNDSTKIQIDTLESFLRPGLRLKINTMLVDTVRYIGFEDTSDEPILFVENLNSKDTVGIIYKTENPDYVRGDLIEIQWRIDSIRYAGDSEFLNFTEFLTSSKLVKPLKLTDKKIKFLWRENRYNKEIDAEVNSIILNEEYIKTITEPEKVALALVSTFVGNECSWDGQANESRSNLKCKIPWALNLGYQCSSKQMELLKYWFRNNSQILKELENCPTTPDGATVQDTFDEINIEVKNNLISIFFKASGINLREAKGWEWTENHIYEFKKNELILLKKDVSPIIQKKISVGES